MTHPELVQYLSYLIKAESAMYVLERLEEKLHRFIDEKRPAAPKEEIIPEPKKPIGAKSDLRFCGGGHGGWFVMAMVALGTALLFLAVNLPRGSVLMLIVAAIFFIIHICRYVKRKSEAEQLLAAYEVQIAEYYNKRKEAAKKYQQEFSAYEKDAAEFDATWSYLHTQCYNALDSMGSTRFRLYMPNIINPRYRTHIAVCAFYQYLTTGKCDSLEGPNGAYKLYDSLALLCSIFKDSDKVLLEENKIWADELTKNANLVNDLMNGLAEPGGKEAMQDYFQQMESLAEEINMYCSKYLFL